MLHVKTGGLRNEVELTPEQIHQVFDYAVSLGMPPDRIYYVNYDCTGYGASFDLLRIGTDVFPASAFSKNPNSNVSAFGAIAHELIGHREAARKGFTQENEILEEAQASIRAARFTPGLDRFERYTLIRDGLQRLRKNGYKLKEIKHVLHIIER